MYVARQVDADVGEQIPALELAGVNVDREDRREMPGGDTGRSVIGADRTSTASASPASSCSTTTVLDRHRRGEMTCEVAPGGRSIPGSETVTEAPVPGDDLVLTLDRSIQFATEQALLERVDRARRPRRHGHRDGHRHRRDLRHGVGAIATTRPVSTRSRRATSPPSTPTSPARWPRSSPCPARSTRARHARHGVRRCRGASSTTTTCSPTPHAAPRRVDDGRADPGRVVEHRHDHGRPGDDRSLRSTAST